MNTTQDRATLAIAMLAASALIAITPARSPLMIGVFILQALIILLVVMIWKSDR